MPRARAPRRARGTVRRAGRPRRAHERREVVRGQSPAAAATSKPSGAPASSSSQVSTFVWAPSTRMISSSAVLPRSPTANACSRYAGSLTSARLPASPMTCSACSAVKVGRDRERGGGELHGRRVREVELRPVGQPERDRVAAPHADAVKARGGHAEAVGVLTPRPRDGAVGRSQRGLCAVDGGSHRERVAQRRGVFDGARHGLGVPQITWPRIVAARKL